MALSVVTATRIVSAVVQDSESRKRIDSPLAKVLPDRLGVAGGVRNVWMILQGNDGSEPEAAKLSCVGIADATSEAINGAKIPGVASATMHDRPNTKTEHTATLVVMEDGSEYVFDWHTTLKVHEPMIYRKKEWDRASGGVLFSAFKGFE